MAILFFLDCFVTMFLAMTCIFNGIDVSKKKTKEIKKAVALQYQASEQNAPIVTAKGQGFIAEKIITMAKKRNIPIKDDPDLVQILSQIDLGEEIPASVYKVVAEIFAFIYHLNTRYQEEKNHS